MFSSKQPYGNNQYYGLMKNQLTCSLEYHLNNIQDIKYLVDEKLRETLILEDTSIKVNKMEYICDYFSPIEDNQLQLILDTPEYYTYFYIRSNAFYTPYGMMVTLQNPNSCSNSFILVNDSLIPKNRTINFVDIKSPRVIVNPNIIFCAFFADYIIENIFLSKIFKTLRDTRVYSAVKKSSPCPVIVKNCILPKTSPDYDIQLKDIMVFNSKTDSNMYLITLETYYTKGWKSLYPNMFAKVINHKVYFRSVSEMPEIYKGKKSR